VKDNWEKIRLCEISEIIMGQSPPSKYYNDKKIGIPFFQGVTEFQEYSPKVKKYTTKVTKLARSNDILMSVRAPVGELNILKFDSCIGRGLCAIRSNEETKFIYYLLKNYKKFIKTFSSGTTYESINKEQIGNLIFNIPSEKKERRKITSILSAYDELIENNNRRIEILEEMAETIYKEWFVHFRYPGHENDKMIYSELGKIPEGWEVKKLNDFVEFIKGFEPGTKNYFYEKIPNSIPFLRVGDLNDRNSQIWVDKNITKGKILKKKDIALTLDGTPGIVRIGYYGAYSSGIQKVVIKNEKITWAFLYLLLKSNQIQDTIKAHSSGTTIVHAGSSKKYLKFLLPKTEIIFSFEKRFSILLYLKLFLEEKNRNLKKTRDILLPKLISGTIDVSDLDIKIEEKK